MMLEGDIKVHKRDLPMAALGTRVMWEGVEYMVADESGFGPWAYWIFRPVAVRKAVWNREDSPSPTLPDEPPVYSAWPKPAAMQTSDDVPASFMQGLAESEAGKTVDLDTALTQSPSDPSPVLENPDPPSCPDPAPSYDPPSDPSPSYDSSPSYDAPSDPSPSMDVSPDPSSTDNSGVC